MILIGIFFLLFVNNVMSLQCKTSWPPNCLYNSTCNYKTKECEIITSTSNNRGGIYCTTIVNKKGEDFFIGTMDCMYDQETTKTCRNQTECSLKYTNDQKQFLHCCCDQHFCNLNFTLSDPYPLSTSTMNPYPCQHILCKSFSIIILLIIIIIIIVILIVILFIYRKKFRRSLRKCRGFIDGKTPSTKMNENPEKGPFLPIEDNSTNQQIHYEDLTIGNLLKRGRFSAIYQGLFNNNDVAIKILTSNNLNDPSRALFEHEKNIYSLPFMNQSNILKYFGYSIHDEKLCLITSLSRNGSLKDVLRSRLLNDENELLLIIKQISEGLHYLHTDYRNKNGLTRPPIAHRDLKTENILFINSNQLVICDFAMSTIIQLNQNGSNQEQQIGTARYMSPEILAGTIGCEETALLKCDVYALGIIFWEILSRYPFQNENVKYIQPFEEQLIKRNSNVNNPTVNDMYEITHLSEPNNRPLINQLWTDFNSKNINSIILLIKECWEHTPELRISSGVVCNRINQLTK